MLIRRANPEEVAGAVAKEPVCDRCGVGAEGDLRLLRLAGRTRYAERNVCDGCAEELLEAFVDSLAEEEIAERRNGSADAADLARGR